ncbi:MAG: CpsB/CapC family capsule biosynthesis tyrosine phosphatase [Lachnospiraceae bacterium]|nr:hypothetical protein [bacterium]MDY5517991.1 CpsB/CapC family capsule biosynthesis tyrosine phosphatase [Lachnospiraceae bacterium]
MIEQKGYYDMHCHILPGVDDGSKSMEMSLKMLEMEYRQGVRHVLLTPHCFAGQTQPELLKVQFDELCEQAAEHFPKLQLYLGNELMYSDTIVEELAAGNAYTINQTNYVLVEFYTDISWKQLGNALRRIGSEGYRPILAHMERYECLMRHTERVDELISQGVVMQMNSDSVNGGLFDRQAAECRKLVESGRIHLFGTDAHRMGWREPKLAEGVRTLHKKIKDEKLLYRILMENPGKILAGEYIAF